MPFLEEPRIMPGTRFMLKSVYIPKGEHKSREASPFRKASGRGSGV